MTIICAYCQQVLGTKPGEGTTHGICATCLIKQEKLLKEMIKEQQQNDK